MKLLLGDCLYKLKELEDNSVDSIVTDPPYGLSFMGKQWDYDVPSQEIWEECIRVLKPGGHLLAFAGSRTYHRMAVRIEDAGFEIRDQIMWVYGSGFPKSMDVGKGVDKKLGNDRDVVGEKKITSGGKTFHGQEYKLHETQTITKGNTEWEGWGTALKPAHEPIVMARKPLSEKTVVDNVLEWGTGGINIDESRIEGGERDARENNISWGISRVGEETDIRGNKAVGKTDLGRFPANIIFDEEAGKLLDEQSGISKCTATNIGYTNPEEQDDFFKGLKNKVTVRHNDEGGASRFFYCPKTSKKDRNEGLDGFEEKQQDLSRKEGNPGGDNPRNRGVNKRKNHHPTVKPTDLMLYLIRLVTPKNGTTLDPFMGSGSTGKGAVRGGFDFIGIEREEEYFQIATARIQYEKDNPYNEETGERIETNKNAQKFW